MCCCHRVNILRFFSFQRSLLSSDTTMDGSIQRKMFYSLLKWDNSQSWFFITSLHKTVHRLNFVFKHFSREKLIGKYFRFCSGYFLRAAQLIQHLYLFKIFKIQTAQLKKKRETVVCCFQISGVGYLISHTNA